MGCRQISCLILLVAVLLAPLSQFFYTPGQSLFVFAHPAQQDDFLKPQAPHFHNGGHEDSYIPTSLSEVDSVAELSEYCWQGGEYSGEDIWMKRLPIWEPNDQFPKGRRIGFLLSFANVVVIETSEGLVMLDTSSFMTTHKVKEQIQEWSNQPLHTAVFTHGHFDHVFGVDLWEEEQNELRKQAPTDEARNSIPARVSVVAHRKVVDRFERYKKTLPYNSRINSRQFESEADALFEFPTDFRYPDVMYDRTLTLRVGEEVLELHHAKGETDDATWIWLPERRTVCTGDLFIWHSPNAGNPQKVQRYPAEWAQALREMAALHPRTLLPGHGPPIVGEERVKQALENTANLLEFLVEHTVELMNKGLSLNEIIHTIKVPQEWLDLPYLRPRYDEPEFVINNIWRLYGGWWNLNYAELKPAPRPDLARELSALVGGSRVLVRRALELAAKEEFRLAGHLAQFAIDADPADPEVLKAYSDIFLARANHPSTTSSMARGIFTAASKHYGVVKKGADSTEGEADESDLGFLDWLRSIFSSILNLGRRDEENILPKQVSVKQLNFQWLETVTRPLNFSAVAPEFQHFAHLAEETSSIFEKFIDEEGEQKGGPWSVQKESEGVVTEMREMSDIDGGWNFLAIRGTGEIPFSPREVAAFVLDPAHRYKWDPRNKEETTLAQISPCLYLKYHLVPGKMMVADRDMVYLGFVKYDQEHETYTYSLKSVDSDKAPPAGHNGCVRMEVLGGGLQIRPARNNPEHTEVVFVYVADIGGDIPNAIRRMVGISQTAQIARMREALLP